MSDLGIVVVHVLYDTCFYSYTVAVQTWRCHGNATSVFVCVCVCVWARACVLALVSCW